MALSYTMHVISNTHWDREWRYSYQQIRIMLVDMMDKVLNLLESNPDFKYFHLDSQTAIVEDYLQIRAENEDRIRKLIKNGKLLIGPWYCLPDQFMVGGESLIRNLLLGHKIAARFGAIMKVGYTPFSWGQISQLPQIYDGFGIDTVLFYRGISKTDTEKSEFIWEGADGTKALCSRFSKLPRCNFWYNVYRPVIFNREWGVDDREFHWEMNGTLFRFCDADNYKRDYKLADPREEYHKEKLKKSLERLRDSGKEDFSTSHLLWAQGHDNSAPSNVEPQLINDANELLSNDTIIHSNLPEYVKSLRETVSNLKILKGEMRFVKKDEWSSSLAGQVISARLYIKQANYETESLLTNYTEPFAVFNWLNGGEYPQKFLDLVWRYLLDNHGHDSIGGCSVDSVHEDMIFRFNQAKEIACGLIEKNYLYLASNIDFSESDPKDINIVIINPTNYERNEIVSAYIDIPQEWSGAYAIDPIPLNLTMENDKSEQVVLQPISDESQFPVLQQAIDSPLFLRMTRHHIYFPADRIPAFGYRCFKIKATKDPKRLSGSLVVANNTIENEFIRVMLNSNGTWNIYDKENKKEYKDLGYLWDCGEVGDPWTQVSPKKDQIFNSIGSVARLCLEIDGPLIAQFGIYLAIELPVASAEEGMCRSELTKPLKAKHTLLLARGARRLDVITEIDNPCEDHWLRIMFPTDLDTQKVHVEGQFDVLERQIPRTEDTSEWPEPPLYPNPMNSFVDYSDKEKGIAFINYGLKEYEAFDDTRRTFALTLLRCFPLKIGGVGMQDYSKEQKGSQCLGKNTFRYAIYPHKGNWETGEVFKQTYSHNQQLNIVQVGKNYGKWAKRRSFLRLEPDTLVITGIKKAENDEAIIVRCFNPSMKKITGFLHLDFIIVSAHYVTLEEKPLQKCEVRENIIIVNIKKKKIVTIKIVVKR